MKIIFLLILFSFLQVSAKQKKPVIPEKIIHCQQIIAFGSIQLSNRGKLIAIVNKGSRAQTLINMNFSNEKSRSHALEYINGFAKIEGINKINKDRSSQDLMNPKISWANPDPLNLRNRISLSKISRECP